MQRGPAIPLPDGPICDLSYLRSLGSCQVSRPNLYQNLMCTVLGILPSLLKILSSPKCGKQYDPCCTCLYGSHAQVLDKQGGTHLLDNLTVKG